MQPPSYEFHATASGLGGVIRLNGRETIIPTVASVSLAAAGGEASTTVENYYRDDISFARAESRVVGSVQRVGKTGSISRYLTYSDVLLTNLRLFGRMKVALMQATMTALREVESGHPLRELQPNRSQFSIRLLYRGIEIDGNEVEADVDVDLCQAGTYDQFIKLLGTRKELLSPETQFIAGMTKALPGDVPDGPAAVVGAANEPLEPLKRPPVAIPLVTTLVNGRRETKVPIARFGTARFGHTLIKPDRQRVSLVRLSLDPAWQPTPFFASADELLASSDDAAASGAIALFDHTSGDGGSVTSGENGSNGVPVWE